MDVTCANCGEPWETYHLRHDEVHETEAGIAWIEYKLDCEEYPPPKKPPDLEEWKGKLTKFWREQFAELGWKFGSSVYVVLRCACCKDNGSLPDSEERAERRQMYAELLAGDEDGLVSELNDLTYYEG